MRYKKYTIDEVKYFVNEKNGTCLSNEYINNKTDMTFQCNVCLGTWETNFKSIKVHNTWCPYCSGRYNNNIEIAKQLAINRNGKCLSDKYINNKTNMSWWCGKCYKKWQARLDRIKSGTWCPFCRESWGERTIDKYLTDLNISFTREHILNKCGKQRFDFYISSHNLAIEYDGVQHFQIYRKYTPTLEILEKVQKMDVQKTKYCLNNGIRLLRIAYTNFDSIINNIHTFLYKKDELMFSDIEKYEYILKNIPNTIFSVLL